MDLLDRQDGGYDVCPAAIAGYRFGPFILDLTREVLLRHGQPVRVGSRAISALVALVEAGGKTLPSDMLMQRVWPETHVDRANLRVQITTLRRILREGGNASHIVNEAGRGYRFVGVVERFGYSGQQRTNGTVEAMCFGDFRFYRSQRLLVEHDTPIKLGQKAADILALLLERHGDLVTKAELLRAAWPDGVEETALRVSIASLRRALRDHKENPSFIANVPGRGYRFVCPVAKLD